MVISITIEDSRLSEFSRLYSQFLAGIGQQDGQPSASDEDELWSVQDIADYLRITRGNLYGASRHLLPSDDLVASGGAKNRKWHKADVLRHLDGLGVKPRRKKEDR